MHRSESEQPEPAAEVFFENKLARSFFALDPATVARELIGKYLIRKTRPQDRGGSTCVVVGGRIVETEAYLASGDPASHSFRGETRRNRSMFAAAGTLYVYTIHAKYCLNVSTERAGIGSAVLIRAIEPLWGLEQMRAARGQTDLRRLTRGPAMICQALGVTLAEDGIDLIDSDDFLIGAGQRDVISGSDEFAAADCAPVAGPRVGISRGRELPLRYCAPGNRYVSGAVVRGNAV